MVGMIIKALGLSDYFFVVIPSNEYNASGKTELHSLNSENAVAVGSVNCLRTLIEYKRWSRK